MSEARPKDAPRQGGGEPELEPAIVARAARGDERACRQLVMRYQRPVFALLTRMQAGSGQRDLVEDLAQETFLRVFGALERFDADGSARLSTWILTIATRLALDTLRKRRHPHTSLEDARHLPAAARADRAADRKAMGRAIELALRGVTPDFRAAFVLRAYHELSYAEIAATLECSPGTVKSRIARARMQLREALVEMGYG